MARRRLRYTLILVTVAAGAALAAVGGWRYARASAPLNGPIILISIDSLRADHLPAYGYQKVKTPALDQLAADGTVFDRAYSHAPQTLPAHVALLSGRLPFETGVRDDAGAAGTVKAGERLLPQMLRERGYTTAAVVSAAQLRKETGIGQGFDFFDDEIRPDADSLTPDLGRRDGGESEQIAEKWLESAGTGRAFLFLHLDEPHAPYTPPDRFAQYAPYDGEIAYADEIVGRLVRYLKSHQLYDRSTIVVVADHGEGLGDHGEQEHGLFVYDEAIHVPLIVKQEGNARAGRRERALVQHIDLVPTILDLVKAPVPAALRGRSLKPLLEGSGPIKAQPVYAEALYSHLHFGWSELTGVTDERYAYIRAPHEELYDLSHDPAEKQNLAATDAAALRTASAGLDRVGAADVVAAEKVDAAVDPKDHVQLIEDYRQALVLTGSRRWTRALELLQRVVGEEPNAAEAWERLAGVALLLNQPDVAVDAFTHLTALKPMDPAGELGAADALFRARKLEDAHAHAAAAVDLAGDKNRPAQASAHELLARIALARHDADTAREEAEQAHRADPASALPPFVDARLLYDQGKFEEAEPLFEQAIAATRKPGATPLAELHYDAGDTLLHLDRAAEAETEFNEELRLFPQNIRARAALATMYHAGGQADAAGAAIAGMLQASPTPDSYALAVKLWKSFGQRQQADAVRAEALGMFPPKKNSEFGIRK